MSNEIAWAPTGQVRVHHSVDEAIKIVTDTPRPVEDMPLAGWTAGEFRGRAVLRHAEFLPCFYKPDHLPNVAEAIKPLLVGEIRGKRFIIDGQHRLAKWLLLNRPTIPAVVLTAAETAQCIRKGMEDRVAQLDVNQVI